MKDISVIIILLNEIHELLLKANEINGADYIKQIKNEFETSSPDDLKFLIRKALNIFGGSGSFSDLVLYEKESPNIELNDILNNLRIKLHEELIKLLSKR
jgi:hypothetical protein